MDALQRYRDHLDALSLDENAPVPPRFDKALGGPEYLGKAMDIYWAFVERQRDHIGIDALPPPWVQEELAQKARRKAYWKRIREEEGI